MSLQTRIVDLLQQTPGMNSNQIAEAVSAKVNSVKVTLNKLVKTEKVVREKMPRPDASKAGPLNMYCYKVKQ